MLTKEATVTFTALAFLAGLIFGLASCAPEAPPRCDSQVQAP
jgi:hypothetical protein